MKEILAIKKRNNYVPVHWRTAVKNKAIYKSRYLICVFPLKFVIKYIKMKASLQTRRQFWLGNQ